MGNNIDGDNNVGIGYAALENGVSTNGNVAIGVASLYSNTTAGNNTAIGYQALHNADFSSSGIPSQGNTAIGMNAGYNYIGTGGTFFGNGANVSDRASSSNNVSAWGNEAIADCPDGNCLVIGASDDSVQVAIGTSTPISGYDLSIGGRTALLGYVNIGTEEVDYPILENDILNITGTIDGYLDVAITNKSSGTSASTDLVLGNDLTTVDEDDVSYYYTDLGMNGSNYEDTFGEYTAISVPNQTYLYNSDSAVSIGTASTTGDGTAFVNFFTGGFTNERMRITEDGLIGIGTTTPTSKLSIQDDTNWLNLTNGVHGIDFTWEQSTIDYPLISGLASSTELFGADLEGVAIKNALLLVGDATPSIVFSTYTDILSSIAQISFEVVDSFMNFTGAKKYKWFDSSVTC
jgi:hypothetical protein